MGKKKELNKVARKLGYRDIDHLEMNVESYGQPLNEWTKVIKDIVNTKQKNKNKIIKVVLEVIHSKKGPFEDSELIAIFSEEFENISKEIANKLIK